MDECDLGATGVKKRLRVQQNVLLLNALSLLHKTKHLKQIYIKSISIEACIGHHQDYREIPNGPWAL